MTRNKLLNICKEAFKHDQAIVRFCNLIQMVNEILCELASLHIVDIMYIEHAYNYVLSYPQNNDNKAPSCQLVFT